MIDLKPVALGIEAAERMANRIVQEVVVPHGQRATATETDQSDWRDYLVGAARAIATNLRNLAAHQSRYREVRYAQDFEARGRVSAGRPPYPTGSPEPKYHEREIELDAAEQGVWVASGAVLDCLAAVLVGLTGLRMNLIKVDFGDLDLPNDDLADYPVGSRRVARALAASTGIQRDHQVRALRSLAVAVDEAGPRGWVTWLLAMRNMSVHREHRNEMITFEQTRAHGVRFYRLPPRDPSVSNMTGFRAAAHTTISDFYLFENIQDVMTGITDSLTAVTAATVEILTSTLDWRAEGNDVSFDASSQWSITRRTSGFEGYGREVPRSVLDDAVMIVNPLDAARLKAANLLTDPRP